ncbi:RES family NAD+ phosphorylase [Spirosoma utsteinense]|uniref:RES family NAD+ phosphorylase n=1 Tax=Spirosoma utsteinense TaxID=2585773 RepID=UPI001646BA2A|nr:RES family NAD+ phosphorylase [Spirosoma utsteinense]MBC3787798.1 RES domain-containing protein [Spirosoma utsteinense]
MGLLYRIIRDKYRQEPLSVVGSRLFGGRWNPKGTGVLYATSTPELGLVETLAHAPAVRYEDLPTYWVFSLEVPDDIRYFSRDQLPAYWQDETYERTQAWLTPWLSLPEQLGVAVPSVLVPLSYNVLLHPAHPLFDKIQIVGQEIQPVNRRLWRSPMSV